MSQLVLSPQEKRIALEGHQSTQTKLSNSRVQGILDSFKGSRPKIDIERARYFTESFRESEGEALILRWSKALLHYAKNATVYIDENQLIVGRSGYAGRYGLIYPELDGDFLDIVLRDLPTRETSPFDISDADAEFVINQIAPYWKGKTFHEDLAKALSPDTLKLTYNPNNTLESRFIVNETASFRSSIQWVHDFEKVLKVGFNGIKKEATEQLAELDEFSAVDSTEKAPFLQAIINVSDAIILWAKRHSKLAYELAQVEEDETRKQELLLISEITDKVPANPAESFHEALQSQWFTQMFSRIEQKTGTVISNGRMDQYLYPYFKKDIESGNISLEDSL